MLSNALRRPPLFSPRGGTSSRVAPLAVGCLVALALLASDASAGQLPVDLRASGTFAVLAGTTVTNSGLSTLNGDLGVSPGWALTGFPPGKVNGKTHAADPVAGQAQTDLTTAYNDAAGRTPPNALPADVGGRTLAPGVYKSGVALGLTGTLTLDAQGDPNAVFVFQVGSELTTAVGSRVNLIGGAQAGNVFWQIGSSAKLGTSSVFAGTILAYTSISMRDGVTLNGRALARNGAVTLINDTINAASPAKGFRNPPRGARNPPRGAPINYAALGDSYSSGEGLNPYLKPSETPGGGSSPDCHRSPRAYPAPRVFPNYTERYPKRPVVTHSVMLKLFAACSGATAENIYKTGQCRGENAAKTVKKCGGDQFAQAQRAGLNNQIDLVSITIGGDDLGFAKNLRYCFTNVSCQKRRGFKRDLKKGFDKLKQNLPKVFSAINTSTQRHALIVALGYPRVFPTYRDVDGDSRGRPESARENRAEQDIASEALPTHFPCTIPTLTDPPHNHCRFDPEEQRFINGATDQLNSLIAGVVNALSKRGVPIIFGVPAGQDNFDDHVNGEYQTEGKQWLNGITGKIKLYGVSTDVPNYKAGEGSYHPTARGQKAYGDYLYGLLTRHRFSVSSQNKATNKVTYKP